MWDKKFDLSSITKDMDAVILVPDEDDSVYLMQALESAGFLWRSGHKPTSLNYWDKYLEDTCYIICESEISCSNRELQESKAKGTGLKNKLFFFDRFPEKEIHQVSKDEINILLNIE